MTTLHQYHQEKVKLADCLSDSFAGVRLEGFLQTPSRLIWLDGTQNPAGVDGLEQAYEARLFCDRGELRWLRDPESAGDGRAAWLSEQNHAPDAFEELDCIQAEDIIDGQILAYPPNPHDADAPADFGGYAIREYIGYAPGTAGEDGNLMVREQRILRTLTSGEMQ